MTFNIIEYISLELKFYGLITAEGNLKHDADPYSNPVPFRDSFSLSPSLPESKFLIGRDHQRCSDHSKKQTF